MKIYPSPIYDLDELARYNLHVHTAFSRCGKLEMLLPAMLARAEAAGLDTIAITDHYNTDMTDANFLKYIESTKRCVAAIGSRVRVLMSGELSCYDIGTFLEQRETSDALDYRLYTTNHYHLDFWRHPEEKTARGYAVHMLEMYRALCASGRADCAAHPFATRFIRPQDGSLDDSLDVTRAITDNELGELCELAARTGVAMEINVGTAMRDPDIYARMWNYGKECGLAFHFGTDTHTLDRIDTRQFVDDLKVFLK